MERFRIWWWFEGGKELAQELWYRIQMLIIITVLAAMALGIWRYYRQ